MTESDALVAIARAGLTPALLAVGRLLSMQHRHGPMRWRDLTTGELSWHLVRHVVRVWWSPQRVDPDTHHPEAAHVAARALMVLTRCIEEHHGHGPMPTESRRGH